MEEIISILQSCGDQLTKLGVNIIIRSVSHISQCDDSHTVQETTGSFLGGVIENICDLFAILSGSVKPARSTARCGGFN